MFLYSLALSSEGDILAAGSPKRNSGTGQVTIYGYSYGVWNQIGLSIDGTAPGDEFGGSVAMSANGQVVAVGATGNDATGDNAGLVKVYRFDATADIWRQLGQDLEGSAAYDLFGYSIALSSDGRTLAVGAPYHNQSSAVWWAGQAVVFEFDTSTNRWTPLGDALRSLTPSDRFGWSIDLSADGHTLAVGAPWSPMNGEASGNVRVFKLNTETETKTWEQQGRDMQGHDLGRWFGNTLIISHDGLTVAASIWGDIPGRPVIDFAGVRVFQFDSAEGEWIELGDGVPGQTLYDPLSTSVTMSADGAVIVSAWDSKTNTSTVRAFILE
jgi:hypothetical protein